MTVKDFKKCITSNNGKTYCWDNEIKSWVIIEPKKIAIDDLPKDIIQIISEEFIK